MEGAPYFRIRGGCYDGSLSGLPDCQNLTNPELLVWAMLVFSCGALSSRASTKASEDGSGRRSALR